jgi:hypothetical protein
MANRLNAPNQFETLSPPWILSQLDTNFTQNQAAWNDSSLGFVNGIPVDTGSANNYLVTLPLGAPSSYQNGMTVVFNPANNNTGASTITVASLGSAAILTAAGSALGGGEIISGTGITLVYSTSAPVGFRIVGNQYVPIVAGYTSSVNQTLICDGASSVSAVYNFSAAATVTLSLSRLRQGVPVSIAINSFSSGTSTLFVGATNPAGGSYTIQLVQQGVVGVQSGIALSGPHFAVGNGMAVGTQLNIGFTVA